MGKRLAALPTLLFALSACTLDGTPVTVAPGADPGGKMVLIRAAGKSFDQGSIGPMANPDERPVVRSTFGYDYFMDSTEVTQADFFDRMGYNPVKPEDAFGAGGNYPVHGLSWFDAVLYANARSKSAHLDTVYAYTRADRSPGGSAYDLVGLGIRLDKRGYRLPTEAEWEFAAHAGAASDFPWGGVRDSAAARRYAWYAANAGGKSHPVASLQPDAFGLYDMAGNVSEWVNDWKGAYPQSPVADFAGARDPGAAHDASIKGGAFKYGLRELRPANRSATYATIRSATAEYVGFRCVLAALAQPAYSDADGALAQTDPVRLEIGRPQSLIGGRAAKLVFVNATPGIRHLVYVDYSEYPPRVREFGDAADVFHPSLSPDGEWVAYGTAPEGAVSGSGIYVRRLGAVPSPAVHVGPGFIPRWWIDPAARDTFLLFTHSAPDNSQSQWPAGETLLRKWSAGGAGPEIPLAEGSFHDGRSADGRWLATGFRLLKVRDAVTGNIRTLFTAPENGKAAGDTSQVCNVSMAPDSSGRTLFLDFGYEGSSALTGSYYDIHAMAFVARPDGKVTGWYPAPERERGWDDLEWSNRPDYAVSAATGPSGGHGHLYLLNLRASAATLLASGTWLATPSLWLGPAPDSIPSAGLDLDSLGHYNEPSASGHLENFANKMDLFWRNHADMELIFTGSSHVEWGIDPRKITRYNSFDMGFPAEGWLGQEEWINAYALRQCPRLKVLVAEVFPGILYLPGGEFFWTDEVTHSVGLAYDRAHDFWKDGLPFGFETLVGRAPNPRAITDPTGYSFLPNGGWGLAEKPPDGEWDLNNPNYLDVMSRIEAFARMIADRKIHLILVNFPTNPAYRGTEYYGTYGPRMDLARGIIERFRAMEGISPYVHFYDAHQYGNHDYTDADAYDSGHLSSQGAEKLTHRLDSLINTLR